ncbi:uncharacterized protein LOC123553508 [Mercenaria mercenaria]|uniref:uncharacterized protein LOC123553508 n=1 Tax=Mercenaria mercenaria TaxID=6596 RepID=UPI00234E78B3|nr:uncharacterized protein LOC123553508 [Mercenaria mercenaria]
MDNQHTIRIMILFCLVTGHLCLISIEFCSGKSVKDYFDGSLKESALKLDGSNSIAALLPTQTGQLSCTCDVTPYSSVPDKLHVRLVHGTRLDTKSCYKNLEVREDDDELEHVFGCSSENIELTGLEEGVRFTLNLFENSRRIDDMYYLYIVPEPGTVLTAQCHAPVHSTSTLAGNATESSTMTSTTKPRAFVTAESSDTIIVVGVVVGLGLFFLVFISCMLFYIARRKVRRDVPEKSNPAEQSQLQHHNIVGRTLTHIYGKMKANRPLPSIPASIRKMTPWKMRNQNGSGVYDSIKSNKTNCKHNLKKQESQQSDCSYLEPVVITTISETVANTNTVETKKHIEADTALPASAVMNVMLHEADYTDLAHDSYIHPLSEYERSNDQKGAVHSRNKYENVLSPPMYMNEQETKAIDNGTQKQDVVDTNKDTKIELNGSGYMAMHANVKQNEGQNDVDEANVEMKECNKDILNGTDSSGYMSMNSSEIRKTRDLLKQNDSTFPDIVRFTSHDACMDEACLKEKTGVANDEKQMEEMKNVKTKRYVRDKK